VAYLFIRNQPGEWEPRELGDGDGAAAIGGGLALMRADAGGGETWVLLAEDAAAVRVNGVALATGIRALQHGDEIRLDSGSTCFFSSERLPSIEPFAGGGGNCPRCRNPIAAGTPVVRCPGCRSAYHQDKELACYSYAEDCVVCGQPTQLTSHLRWTPEAAL
jgi:hypothetical protein